MIRTREFRLNKEEISTGERAVFVQQTNELIDLYGVDCVFYPLSHSEADVFGETNKSIEQGTDIRLLLEEIEEDFDSEDSAMFSNMGLMSAFGKATFSTTQEYLDHYEITPKVDDLILYKKRNKTFQITQLDKEKVYIRITSIPYDYDSTKVSPNVLEQETLDLEQIEDVSIVKINDKLQDVLDNDPAILEDQDGLFG